MSEANQKIIEPIMQGSDSFHVYSNNAEIGFTPWDLRLKFREIVDVKENRPVVNFHGTVVMTPAHAKVLLSALQRSISMYEERFGTVDLTKVLEVVTVSDPTE